MPIFKSLTGQDLSEGPARSLTPISHETDISHLAPEGIAIKSFSTFVPTSQFGLSQILFGASVKSLLYMLGVPEEIEFNIELNSFNTFDIHKSITHTKYFLHINFFFTF